MTTCPSPRRSLNACNLTAACCEALASVVGSSKLRELDLSNNKLTDAGVMQLAGGLKSSRLQTLRSVADVQ